MQEDADGLDAGEQAVATKRAAPMQARWGCPGRFSEMLPRSGGHLGADERMVLRAVQRLTGMGETCTTCPRKYAALPFVRRAATAHFYLEKGCPEYVEPHPSVAMVQAIESVGIGVARYTKRLNDELRAKATAFQTQGPPAPKSRLRRG